MREGRSWSIERERVSSTAPARAVITATPLVLLTVNVVTAVPDAPVVTVAGARRP
ncbi:hypothetical protein DSECCO2_471040 [anaerobic digester metagenome]